MDGGAWRATVHRVTKSRTRLKQLSVPHNLFSPHEFYVRVLCYPHFMSEVLEV